MERDHTVLLERTKEAEQVAQKIEVDSIQDKMALVSWDHVMQGSCDAWHYIGFRRVMNKILTS